MTSQMFYDGRQVKSLKSDCIMLNRVTKRKRVRTAFVGHSATEAQWINEPLVQKEIAVKRSHHLQLPPYGLPLHL